MMNVLRYHHIQFGTVIVVSVLLATLVLAGVGATIQLAPLTVGGPLALVVLLALFYALTVEIDATHLRFRFGVGLIRKSIPLAEIVEVKSVRNLWLYGWGIHITPHGWLYNVSGWEAVEITLASGKHLRLGTDEPRKLARAIQVAQGG